MRAVVRLIVAGMLLPFVGIHASAGQSRTLGTVRGVVHDSASVPLSGVTVILSVPGSESGRLSSSGRDGSFRFVLVPAGTYEVSAERLGYRPLVVLGVAVRPGVEAFVPITLTEEPPPVERVDTVTFAAAGGGVDATGAVWFSRQVMRDLPLPADGLTGPMALRPGSAFTPAGLPLNLATLEVDGLAPPMAVHPAYPGGLVPDLAWPRDLFGAAEWIPGALDAGRPGAPAGVLAGYLLPGTSRLTIRAAGEWQPGGATGSRFYSPESTDPAGWRTSAVVTGPIVRDTAHFMMGIVVGESRQAHPSAWDGASGSGDVADTALAVWGVDLTPWTAVWLERRRQTRVLGRVDVQVAGRHAIRLHGTWGRLEVDQPSAEIGRGGLLGARAEGTDWFGGGSVVSRFGSLANEVRLGFGRVERVRDAAGPRSVIVSGPLGIGPESDFRGTHARQRFTFTESIHAPAGRHDLGFGLGIDVRASDVTWAWGVGGEMFFADATRFSVAEGSLVEIVGTVPTVRHTQVGLGAWFEDVWHAAPGLDLHLIARLDVTRRPADAVATNDTWLARSGLDNAAYDASVVRVSPRAALEWSPGTGRSWAVRLDAGIFATVDEADLFSELIAHDGRVMVRREVGFLTAWPQVAATGTPAPRLALFAPGFVPPRAARAGLSIARALGGATLRVAGVYRHVDFLPRRTDLNRLPAAAGTDQHGRPLYGALMQQAGLLAAVPGSNRRFREFDLVSGLNADGFQDRWEMTLALDRRFGDALGFLVAYTWSRTIDNWLGAVGWGPDDQLDPFPDGSGGWADGTSDLDVPSRLVVALEFKLPAGLRVGGVFRHQSGRPFTAGFRPGVDANADGSARNDPAFVEAGIAGFDQVLAEWPCLRADVGRFATRNACRADAEQSLDLWLRVALPRVGGLPLALLAQMTNVVEPDRASRDRALYLVDGTAALASDAATGVATVPLIINPSFGAPLARVGSARVLRIGLRINDQ